jgi:hypothetical protein
VVVNLIVFLRMVVCLMADFGCVFCVILRGGATIIKLIVRSVLQNDVCKKIHLDLDTLHAKAVISLENVVPWTSISNFCTPENLSLAVGYAKSPIFLLRGAILWGSIFLMRQEFSKHLPHKKNCRAHNSIKTWKSHPETRKLGFTSPQVNKHLACIHNIHIYA